MKKIRFSVLALVLAGAFAFAGCDAMRGSGWNDDPFGDGGSSGGRISIAISSAGYGTDWIQNIMDEYTEATGVRFATLQTDPINGNLASQVANGNAATDIVITVGGMFRAQSNGMLEDLSGVYAATPEGESEPISEKTNRSVYERLLTDDGIYQMSWINGAASIIYNKTYIDEIAARDANDELGADWEENLPRTTDELNEFARKIYAAGGVPFICSPNISYYDYLRLVWWAQYSGIETWENFYQFESPEVFNDEGRTQALRLWQDLLVDPDDGSVINSIDRPMGRDHMAAQTQFVSGNAAMTPTGSWIETEVGEFTKPGFRMKMMATPLIEGAKSDEQLLNTSAGDFACIPKNADNVDAAKAFLAFMNRPEWVERFTQLTGVPRAFNYKPSTIEETSEFAQSCFELFENSTLMYRVSNSPLYIYANVSEWPKYGDNVYGNLMTEIKVTPEWIVNDMYEYAQKQWSTWEKLS